MKIVHDWLKDYIGDSIPSPAEIDDLLTFHTFEIDGIEKVGEHEVIDVDVLPNRSSDCLSHRGVAREIASLTGVPLANDPLSSKPKLPTTDKLKVSITDATACRHFDLALLRDIKIQDSPKWLQERLIAIGQRPINNVVDATNYVMFGLGQPLHAYDGDKFAKTGELWNFGVRFAKTGEKITTLTGEEYELDDSIQLIVNESDGALAGIAGIKGGKYAEVDKDTTTIILEAGNFEPSVTRRASQKLRLQTDASKRYENNVSSELIPYAIHECAKLIVEIAGGKCEGYSDNHPTIIKNTEVTVTLSHINSLLGLSLSTEEVTGILTRLGFSHSLSDETFSVTAPFERTDINIAEDVIEEVGRVYGYGHVESVVPTPVPVAEINARHYYSEEIRETLLGLGFYEVITSSFRKKDEIRLLNALASDKGYLRSSLIKNIEDVLTKNISYIDFLGVKDIRVFEIGTVFTKLPEGGVTEHMSLCVGVRQKQTGYTPKDDDLLETALSALSTKLGVDISWTKDKGIAEASITELIANLPKPLSYQSVEVAKEIKYKPYSQYPSMSRDIALWVSEGTSASEVEEVLDANAGELRVRTTLFDQFTKDGKTSFAFRFVFQSYEKTLTDSEVNAIMDGINLVVSEREWEVR